MEWGVGEQRGQGATEVAHIYTYTHTYIYIYELKKKDLLMIDLWHRMGGEG
jgi:hypothetical protein